MTLPKQETTTTTQNCTSYQSSYYWEDAIKYTFPSWAFLLFIKFFGKKKQLNQKQ